MSLARTHGGLSINRVTAKLTLVFLLCVQIAYALPRGAYQIVTGEGQNWTLETLDSGPNSPVVLFPEASNFEWNVVPSAGGYHIQSAAGLYLAVLGTIQTNAQIVINSTPQVWNVHSGHDPTLFWISPMGHNALVLDRSFHRIYPPRVALQQKTVNPMQFFRFEPR